MTPSRRSTDAARSENAATTASMRSVCASNTEPLLRLNAEAPTREDVDAVVDEVLAIVRA